MRKTGFLTILFVIVTSAFGCGSASTTSNSNKVANTSTMPSLADEASLQKASSPANAGSAVSNTAAKSLSRSKTTVSDVTPATSLDQTQNSRIDTAPTDRKIIRNADLSLETDAPEETQRQITAIAESNGGFVVESQQTSSDVRATKRDIVSMSIRIPSEKFAGTLDQIRGTSERVIFETIKGDDVTEEFIDVEARLKAKKALEQQFVDIMKRASNVEDALNVQRELAEVRSEIEKIEGRKRFLENQASLSTIKIKLQTPAAFLSSSSGFSSKLGQSFGTGFDFALNCVLGIVTFVVGSMPFLLFIGLPAFLVLRYFWKRQNRPLSMSDIAKEELE